MVNYPAIAECIKEEGLDASLYGPRPHGFGVQVKIPNSPFVFTLTTLIDDPGTLHCSYGMSGKMKFDIADPNVWKQIKELADQCSRSMRTC